VPKNEISIENKVIGRGKAISSCMDKEGF